MNTLLNLKFRGIVSRAGSMSEIMGPRIIQVQGSHYQMGLQHAQQVQLLLPAIHDAIEARFAQLAADNPDDGFERIVRDTIHILDKYDPATLDFVRGLSEGMHIAFDRLLRYNLITFLRIILTTRRRSVMTDQTDEGCSTWAATGTATTDGQPVLVKNRDFSLLHLPLQLVVRAEPEQGYHYTYVTSAGSPGVFVAGFNEAGLALVDTAVSSTDVGPGLPTFSLSMHILEEHESVHSALEYLKAAPRLGRNNLLLADASGDVALFEIGNRNFGIRYAESGILVNTNHFTCDETLDCFIDTSSDLRRGNSHRRFEYLTEQLAASHGAIDVSLAKMLMASHTDALSSLCRHPDDQESSSTISASIYLPAQKRMFFCHGYPCSQNYVEVKY